MNRPGGARPQPASSSASSRRDSARLSGGRPSLGTPPASDTSSLHMRSHSDVQGQHRPSHSGSVSSRYSTISGRGRDYYPERPAVAPLKPGDVVPSDTYIERGQRWMEKEEAYSLREAMQDMDLKEAGAAPPPPDQGGEEQRIYQDALDEAAELVWQHQNGIKPPQPGTPYKYKQHLRKNSYAHARTASVGCYGDDIVPTGLARDPSSRSVSGSSTSSGGGGGFGSRRSRLSYGSTTADDSARPSREESRGASMESAAAPSKPYSGLAHGPRPMAKAPGGGRRRSSLKRNISGEVAKPFSGDQIYEEPAAAASSSSSGASSAPADQSGDAQVQPLRLKPKNPLNRVVQFAPEVAPSSPEAAVAAPPKGVSKLVSRYEIHRNPPSQSRNPQYTTNAKVEQPSPAAAAAAAAGRDDVPRKNGVEIRSDDIRQATSMRLKDRSAKLPTPSYVSDNPGRPIVSFDANWKAPEEATDEKLPDPRRGGPLGSSSRGRQAQQQAPPSIPSIPAMEGRQQAPAPFPSRARPPPPSVQVDVPSIPDIAVSEPPRHHPQIPSISASDSSTGGAAPLIPTIVVPDEGPEPSCAAAIPVIVTPDDDDNNPSIPVIITPDDSSNKPSAAAAPRRPLPTPSARGSSSATTTNRPAAAAASARPRGHWSPAPAAGSRATALCHECGFPIEGRFVGLAGQAERFHPACFACYACGTALEALEISPEPDAARAARLERIRRRARGEVLQELPGETMAEDGDDRLRFYCHLDWHERFAPRCKHCTTPILGEHVVALGARWHPEHFFCAECGDPFGPGATHIEKDGYAWCVACQTRRTERRAPRCKACDQPVLGQYVRALAAEWHDACFRCAVCHGGFDDGQIFPREGAGGLMQVVCTACRERELKA